MASVSPAPTNRSSSPERLLAEKTTLALDRLSPLDLRSSALAAGAAPHPTVANVSFLAQGDDALFQTEGRRRCDGRRPAPLQNSRPPPTRRRSGYSVAGGQTTRGPPPPPSVKPTWRTPPTAASSSANPIHTLTSLGRTRPKDVSVGFPVKARFDAPWSPPDRTWWYWPGGEGRPSGLPMTANWWPGRWPAPPVPVLTALGHSSDRSVADEVAWRSVATPSAAAALVCELVADADRQVVELGREIASLARRRIEDAGERWNASTLACATSWTWRERSDRRPHPPHRRSLRQSSTSGGAEWP